VDPWVDRAAIPSVREDPMADPRARTVVPVAQPDRWSAAQGVPMAGSAALVLLPLDLREVRTVVPVTQPDRRSAAQRVPMAGRVALVLLPLDTREVRMVAPMVVQPVDRTALISHPVVRMEDPMAVLPLDLTETRMVPVPSPLF